MLPPIHTVAGVIVLNPKSDHVIPLFKINPWVFHHMFQWKLNFLHLPYEKNPLLFRGQDSSPHPLSSLALRTHVSVLWNSLSFRLPITCSSSHTSAHTFLSTGNFLFSWLVLTHPLRLSSFIITCNITKFILIHLMTIPKPLLSSLTLESQGQLMLFTFPASLAATSRYLLEIWPMHC